MGLQELVGTSHGIKWEEGKAVSVSLSNRPEMGDDDIVVLLEHPTIKKLCLGGSGVTDRGVPTLRGLSQLEWLELSDTAVTDVGLGALSGMTALQSLLLYGCEVTDASLPALLSMTGLREIGLDETLISKKARKALTTALPELEIS